MEQYIPKSVVLAEIEKRKKRNLLNEGAFEEDIDILYFLNTLEVKEFNEVPATVMVNKYGNRFISSWPGLKEYDDFKEGEEIKIVIQKK